MAAVSHEETGGSDEKIGDDTLGLEVHSTDDDLVRITVVAPELPVDSGRLPAILCCVVDISGSMGTEAVIKDADGKAESHGLTILDLVKHAIKTIVNCLDDKDYLSIVSYSTKAAVVTDLMPMHNRNKDITLKALEKLQPTSQTNLWDGLFQGLEVLRQSKAIKCSRGNSGIFLFTDGQPNIIPPKGHIGMLDTYMDSYQDMDTIINTYGFGYSLDSKLLNDLAVTGHGTYSFIPDSSFVGTIFVNSLSNFCSHVAKNVMLNVELDAKACSATVLGGYKHTTTSWGLQISLGTVAYQQSKSVVLKLDRSTPGPDAKSQLAADSAESLENQPEGVISSNPSPAQSNSLFSLTVNSLTYSSLRQGVQVTAAGSLTTSEDAVSTARHHARLIACDALRKCMACCKMADYADAKTALKQVIAEINGDKVCCKLAAVQGLLEDLTGQGFQAIGTGDAYVKWGKHYVPSLVFAHLHEYNNNFKDAGVQFYGGELFKSLRDNGNDVFIKLPPPKPSKQYARNVYGRGGGGGVKAQAKAAAPVNMRMYYNAGGGCFDGGCMVRVVDGFKRVDAIEKGDVLFGGGKVSCVVRHKCAQGKVRLCRIGGLAITEYHPVVVDGTWKFPVDVVGRGDLVQREWVYNFVLDGAGVLGHVMQVGGLTCVTLGHGLVQNEVVSHEYFGTEKVVNDLKGKSGWSNGVVCVDSAGFTRNAEMRVIGMRV